MKWLARVKTGKPLSDHATKPTKPGFVGFVAPTDRGEEGFVGFVASLDRGFQKLPLSPGQAANDRAASPGRGVQPGDDVERSHAQARTRGGEAELTIPIPRPRARGAGPVDMPAPMTADEVDVFMARVERFTSRGLASSGSLWGSPSGARGVGGLAGVGLAVGWAERLADRLLLRDREGDDRQMCVECRHCAGGRSCGRTRAAGLGHHELGELAVRLQRCPAFTPAINTQGARP